MNHRIGWGLAVVALVFGGWRYGWQGVLVAVTVIAFWLLLDLTRSMRILRAAAERPVGQIASARQLHTRLKPGLTTVELVKLAGTVGEVIDPEVPVLRWSDAYGDAIEVRCPGGRASDWTLKSAEAGQPA
jgi:hypothetical protein